MEQVSHGREADREFRLQVMEHMRVALRLYKNTGDEKWVGYAKALGEHSKYLDERMRSHDYPQEDAARSVVIARTRELSTLLTSHGIFTVLSSSE